MEEIGITGMAGYANRKWRGFSLKISRCYSKRSLDRREYGPRVW